MAIAPKHLALLADVVHRRSGLALPPDKAGLVTSKLAPVAARFGFKKIDALLEDIGDEPEELAWAVTEAMTTNDTSFFRDRTCFDQFRTVILPALIAARADKRRLRIWCAAASNGQEPYSLAMLLDEARLAEQGWKIDLFATDLSTAAVARTQEGLYSHYEVERGLPSRYLARYFTQEVTQWRIAERLRHALRVRRFNLLDNYGWLGEIDAIFCRNVLIYFDHQTKLETLMRLGRSLAPDGWLVLGASESASDSGGAFAASGSARGLYTKVRNAPGRQVRLAG